MLPNIVTDFSNASNTMNADRVYPAGVSEMMVQRVRRKTFHEKSPVVTGTRLPASSLRATVGLCIRASQKVYRRQR